MPKTSVRRVTHQYPERIIPEETFGGPLASHLKRYEFAKQFCAGKLVLDVACGVGYGSVYLAQTAKEVLGADISEEAIAYAKKHYQKGNVQFKIMDACGIKLPDKYFDVVCSFETLEHLNEPLKFMFEVRRLLRENGIFIISTPYAKKTTHTPKNPFHKNEFSPGDFEHLLRKYFKEVEIFGQKRVQSAIHYYLQKLDIFHLRAKLPSLIRKKICHAAATHSWDEAGLEDLAVTKGSIKRAAQLIGVCRA